MVSKEDKTIVIEKAKELIKLHNIKNLDVLEIREVNFKPHTPIIGPKSIEYASNYSNHMLGNDAPCTYPRCNLTLGEHHGDVILFLKLNAVISKNVQLVFTDLQPILEQFKIDGVAFVQEDSSCVFEKDEVEANGKEKD